MKTSIESTTTGAPSAAVLTHPAFDRPPVENERRRGRKKGCLSFMNAKRARWLLQTSAAAAAPEPGGHHPAACAWNSRAKEQSAPPQPMTQREKHEQAVIGAALVLLEAGLRKPGPRFDHQHTVKAYARLQLAALDQEVFAVFYVDTQHCLIAFEVPFRGTLSQTAVYPREIAKRALELNAAAVILAHNHPSGVAEPSMADELLTRALQETLRLVDVRVLDHVVVGRDECISFVESGLL